MKYKAYLNPSIRYLYLLLFIIVAIGFKFFDWGFIEFGIVLSCFFILCVVVFLETISEQCTKTQENISEMREELKEINRTFEAINIELENLNDKR